MCIFIKHIDKALIIVVVYVDDLNIIGTANAIFKIVLQLKDEVEMIDLGETFFFILTYMLNTLHEAFFHIKVCILESYSSISQWMPLTH